MKPGHIQLPGDCDMVSGILSRVGDKWTVLVVYVLGAGPRRFNQLRREIGGISQRMLTLTLRGLERDGLVNRKVTPTLPPRVDYALTDLGRSLLAPVAVLGEWAKKNRGQIERSRSRYDKAAGDGA